MNKHQWQTFTLHNPYLFSLLLLVIITLVNLLTTDGLENEDITPFDPSQADADRVLFPEYLTYEDKSAQVAGHIVEWLNDPANRALEILTLQEGRYHLHACAEEKGKLTSVVLPGLELELSAIVGDASSGG